MLNPVRMKKPSKSRPNVEALLDSWQQILSLIPSDPNFNKDIENSHAKTLKMLLAASWIGHAKTSARNALLQLLDAILHHMGSTHPLRPKVAALRPLVFDPWGHPMMHAICGGQMDPKHPEALGYVGAEDGRVVAERLSVLRQANLTEAALRLGEAAVRAHPRHVDVAVHFLLLTYKCRGHQGVIDSIKLLPVECGVSIAETLCAKRSELRLGKDEGSLLIVMTQHYLLTTLLCPGPETPDFVRRLVKVLADFSKTYPKDGSVMQTALRMLLEPGKNCELLSENLFSVVHIFWEQFGISGRPLCAEICISYLTRQMNELEYTKSRRDKQEIKKVEVKLSNDLLQMAKLVQDQIMIWRECILTAFSLNPTDSCYEKLEFAYAESEKMFKLHGKPRGVMYGKCIADSYVSSDNYGALDLLLDPKSVLDPKVLDISEKLCDDLTVVLLSLRYKTLHWSLDWYDLKLRCQEYMMSLKEELTCEKELRFLKIDFDRIRNFSPQDVRKYYGVPGSINVSAQSNYNTDFAEHSFVDSGIVNDVTLTYNDSQIAYSQSRQEKVARVVRNESETRYFENSQDVTFPTVRNGSRVGTSLEASVLTEGSMCVSEYVKTHPRKSVKQTCLSASSKVQSPAKELNTSYSRRPRKMSCYLQDYEELSSDEDEVPKRRRSKRKRNKTLAVGQSKPKKGSQRRKSPLKDKRKWKEIEYFDNIDSDQTSVNDNNSSLKELETGNTISQDIFESKEPNQTFSLSEEEMEDVNNCYVVIHSLNPPVQNGSVISTHEERMVSEVYSENHKGGVLLSDEQTNDFTFNDKGIENSKEEEYSLDSLISTCESTQNTCNFVSDECVLRGLKKDYSRKKFDSCLQYTQSNSTDPNFYLTQGSQETAYMNLKNSSFPEYQNNPALKINDQNRHPVEINTIQKPHEDNYQLEMSKETYTNQNLDFLLDQNIDFDTIASFLGEYCGGDDVSCRTGTNFNDELIESNDLFLSHNTNEDFDHIMCNNSYMKAIEDVALPGKHNFLEANNDQSLKNTQNQLIFANNDQSLKNTLNQHIFERQDTTHVDTNYRRSVLNQGALITQEQSNKSKGHSEWIESEIGSYSKTASTPSINYTIPDNTCKTKPTARKTYEKENDQHHSKIMEKSDRSFNCLAPQVETRFALTSNEIYSGRDYARIRNESNNSGVGSLNRTTEVSETTPTVQKQRGRPRKPNSSRTKKQPIKRVRSKECGKLHIVDENGKLDCNCFISGNKSSSSILRRSTQDKISNMDDSTPCKMCSEPPSEKSRRTGLRRGGNSKPFAEAQEQRSHFQSTVSHLSSHPSEKYYDDATGYMTISYATPARALPPPPRNASQLAVLEDIQQQRPAPGGKERERRLVLPQAVGAAGVQSASAPKERERVVLVLRRESFASEHNYACSRSASSSLVLAAPAGPVPATPRRRGRPKGSKNKTPRKIYAEGPKKKAICGPVSSPAYGGAYGSPAYGSPAYGSSAYGSPAYGSSAYGSSAYGSSAYGPPAYDGPATCNTAAFYSVSHGSTVYHPDV